MLNLTALDEDDRELLQASFYEISDRMEIVTDNTIIKSLTGKISSFLTIQGGTTFSLQNLFKIKGNNKNIYLAQCLFDFGYPVRGKMTYSYTREYQLQLVGYIELKIDTGNATLRPGNKMDKFIGRFWAKGIKLDDAEKFNNHYYLTADDTQGVKDFFNKNLRDLIANAKNVLLTIRSKELIVTLGSPVEPEQARIIYQILANIIS